MKKKCAIDENAINNVWVNLRNEPTWGRRPRLAKNVSFFFFDPVLGILLLLHSERSSNVNEIVIYFVQYILFKHMKVITVFYRAKMWQLEDYRLGTMYLGRFFLLWGIYTVWNFSTFAVLILMESPEVHIS